VKITSLRRVAAPTAVALALGLGLSACGAGNEKKASGGTSAASGTTLSGTLNGAGSSAQEAAQGAWAAGFQSANSGVTVNYDPSGSGAGVEQFLAGGIQFAGSDSFLTDEQLASSKKVCNGAAAIEVPDYISPIALVYNLPGVDKLQFSPATVGAIFAGKITKWNDAAIKADNPGVTLPSTTISPVHRSDDSGTTNNFTDYLSQAASSTWKYPAAQTWPLKSGEGAQGTSGVIESVTNGKGTIGYADASQAGKLSVASIKVGSAFVAPTAAAAATAADVSPPVSGRSAATDMAIQVDRKTTAAGAYPLVLISYVIACPSYKDATAAALVKNYLTYVVGSDGQAAAAKTAGSAPLSSKLSSGASAAVAKITKG
jgi:phosphate transport system substrate-binding protein